MSSTDQYIPAIDADPVTDFSLEKRPVVYIPNSRSSTITRSMQSSNGTNTNSMKFQVKVESTNQCVAPDMYIHVRPRVTVTMGSGAVDGALPTPNNLAWAPHGLWQICNNLEVMLNTHTVQLKPEQYMNSLGLFNTYFDNRNTQSDLSMPDFCQSYTDFTNAATLVDVDDSKSPFGNVTNELEPRNLWRVVARTPGADADAVAGTPAVVGSLTFEQDLYLSIPFNLFSSSANAEGIRNLSEFDISASFETNARSLAKLLSYSGTPAITDIRLEFPYAPALRYRIIRPAEYIWKTVEDKDSVYGYNEYKRYVANTDIRTIPGAVTGAGGVVTYSSEEFVAPAITIPTGQQPRRIYIFVEQVHDGPAATIDSVTKGARSHALIEKISELTYAQMDHNVLNYNEFDLHRMSMSNGLDVTWAMASRGCGNVLCIDPGKDLNMQGDFIAGSINSNFGVTVRARNLSERALPFRLAVIFEYEKFIRLKRGSASLEDPLLYFQQNALSKSMAHHVARSRPRDDVRIGAGFFGNLWRGIKNAVSDPIGTIKTIGNAVNGVKSLVSSIKGSGEGGAVGPYIGGMARHDDEGASALKVPQRRGKRGGGLEGGNPLAFIK